MPAISESKYLVTAGMDDVPHIAADVKASILRDTPAHLRAARVNGTPSLGSGAIYPYDEQDFIVTPFMLPDWWPRGYGMDVGWNRTAVTWGALDREQDILYLYGEHYRAEAQPAVHAGAIQARGKWIRGVIDPASAGASQVDGTRLIEVYRSLGLNIEPAENSVEAGILSVNDRLSTGRMKVFSNLSNWRREFRLYRRDEKGRIVKKDDHLMDTTRYLVVTGISRMTVRPHAARPEDTRSSIADPTAGY